MPPARLPRLDQSCRGSRSGRPGRGPIPRGRPARGSLPVHLRGSNLDGTTEAGRWHSGSDFDGRIEIIRLEHKPTTHGFLHSDERAIGGQGLAALDAHRGRVLGDTHGNAGGDAWDLVDRFVVGVDLLLLLLRELGPLL